MKRNKENKSVVLTLSVLLLSLCSTYAYNWQKCIGQGGGSAIIGIDVDPNDDRTVFMCGDYDSGIFKSTNSGDTWRQVNRGLEYYFTFQVAVAPGNSSIVYAATRLGPHKSTDGGLSWAKKRNGMPAETDGSKFYRTAPTNSIAIHPTNSNIVYACVGYGEAMRLTGGGAYDRTKNGLWKSTDAGENWKQESSYPAEIGTTTLVINPQNPNIMWAGCGGDSLNIPKWGVYRTTDAGATWVRASNGMGDSLNVWKIVIHPTDPLTAYCVVSGRTVKNYTDPQQPPVWMTTNGGVSWQSRSNGIFLGGKGITGFWRGLAIDKNSPNDLYYSSYGGGIHKSTNGGANWFAVTYNNTPEDNYWSYNNRLGDKRIWLEEQGFEGAIWYANMGLALGNQRPVLYCSAIGVLVRSTDAGINWSTPCNRQRNTNPEDGYFMATGFSNYYVMSIVFDPKDPRYVFCSNADTERLLKSDDGGKYWRFSMKGCRDEHMMDRAANCVVDPDDNRIMYFAERGRALGSCYKSTDHGTSWAEIRDTRASKHLQVVMAPGGTSSTRTLYVVVDAFARGVGDSIVTILKSTNSGQNWAPANTGLSLGNTDAKSPPLMDVAQLDKNILFAGGAQGIYKSTNGGTTWAVSNGTSGTIVKGPITSIAISPYDVNNVFVGQRNPGYLYHTTDGGATWRVAYQVPPPNYAMWARVSAVIFDPTDPTGKTLFMSGDRWTRFVEKDINFENPYMSTDGGATWQSIAEGLDFHNVWSMAVNPHDTTLWIGTNGNGICRTSIAHLKGKNPSWNGEWAYTPSVAKPTTSKTISRTQNIRFDAAQRMLWVPVQEQSKVEIFDGAGRLVQSRSIAAHENARFSLGRQASNLYIVRVTSAGKTSQYRLAALR